MGTRACRSSPGEPGVGKSRLVAELKRHADASQWLVLEGGCVQLEDGECPYLPVVGALRDVAWGADAEITSWLPEGGEEELARILPDLGPAPVAAPAGTAPYSPGGLHELLLLLLRGLSRERPVEMVLEDLHWADGSTRDFLSYLARNLRDERVAVVATYRDGLDPRHPLSQLVGELLRRDVGRTPHHPSAHAGRDSRAALRHPRRGSLAAARAGHPRRLAGQSVLRRGAARRPVGGSGRPAAVEPARGRARPLCRARRRRADRGPACRRRRPAARGRADRRRRRPRARCLAGDPPGHGPSHPQERPRARDDRLPPRDRARDPLRRPAAGRAARAPRRHRPRALRRHGRASGRARPPLERCRRPSRRARGLGPRRPRGRQRLRLRRGRRAPRRRAVAVGQRRARRPPRGRRPRRPAGARRRGHARHRRLRRRRRLLPRGAATARRHGRAGPRRAPARADRALPAVGPAGVARLLRASARAARGRADCATGRGSWATRRSRSC